MNGDFKGGTFFWQVADGGGHLLRNINGPRTDPWGTPDLTSAGSERVPFTRTV